MKKSTNTSKTLLAWMVLMGFSLLVSCKKEDAEPDVSAQLTGKWWCESNKTLADQYFDSNGTFQQRFNGVISTGKWALSTDNKTIQISDVSNNLVSSWSYGLKEVTADKLVINYLADFTFAPCP